MTRKILLFLIVLMPYMNVVAQNQINIIYQDGSKTHYDFKYWCTSPSFKGGNYDPYLHIIDCVYIYEHIAQVDEDFSNLYQELLKDHAYAVAYYKKGDAKILGYNFEIGLIRQYVKHGEIK